MRWADRQPIGVVVLPNFKRKKETLKKLSNLQLHIQSGYFSLTHFFSSVSSVRPDLMSIIRSSEENCITHPVRSPLNRTIVVVAVTTAAFFYVYVPLRLRSVIEQSVNFSIVIAK
jgi:hypothetical protein